MNVHVHACNGEGRQNNYIVHTCRFGAHVGHLRPQADSRSFQTQRNGQQTGINCSRMRKIPHDSWGIGFLRALLVYFCYMLRVLAYIRVMSAFITYHLPLLKNALYKFCYGSENDASQSTLRI